MNPTITDFCPSDADQLIELNKETIIKCYTPFLGEKAVTGYIASGAVDEFYNNPKATLFVVKDSNTCLGCGAITGNYLNQMIVDYRIHRQKIGTLILEEAERRMFADYAKATLDSFAQNEQANSFYTHHGWFLEETFKNPDHEIAMIKLSKNRS